MVSVSFAQLYTCQDVPTLSTVNVSLPSLLMQKGTLSVMSPSARNGAKSGSLMVL